MNIFTQGKTNWKYILIVVVLVIFVSGGVLWYAMKPEIPSTEFPKIEELEKIKEITKPPTIAGLLNDPKLKEAKEVEVVGKYAYVIGGEGLIIIDISNPRNPTIVSSIDISGVGISILDEYAYIVGSSILTIVDISNPASPKIIIAFQDPKLLREEFQDIQVKGEYAYIINDDRHAFMIDNNRRQELVIIDVSDLENPEIVSSIVVGREQYELDLRKIFLSENYCYIVSRSFGNDVLTIIDISNPKNPKKLSSLSDEKLGHATNIFVSGKHAYIITGNNILAIIDISDPTVPSIVNLIEDKKIEFGRKVYVLDKYAYVIGWETFTIIDISNPTAPEIITSISDLKFDGAEDLYVLGRYGYIIAPGTHTQAFVVVDLKGEIIFEGKPISMLSKDVLEFEEKFIKENKRKISFLQDGNIWVISKDLKKKAKIVDTEEAITNFSFSPDGRIIYWLNEKGEIFKKDEQNRIKSLVSVEKDMKQEIQEGRGGSKPFPFLKGKVTGFYLSPDGNYIAYETIEEYMVPFNIPLIRIRIMKSDGTEKIKIEQPSGVEAWGKRIYFNGWLPDSKRILFHLKDFNAAIQGSPFFEVGIDGKNPKIHTEIFQLTEDMIPEDLKFLIIVPVGAEPVYSPTGKKMAHIKEENEIRLKDIDTEEVKTIFESKRIPFDSASNIIKWSKDSSLLLVREIDKVFLFDSTGQTIFEQEFPDAKIVRNVIISPDNKYLVGAYMLKNEKIEIFFFINLLTNEKKEFKLPEGAINIYPQFFSEENKLYYLIRPKGERLIHQFLVIDTNTWKNYKIAENVSQVVKIP